jgi:hypothetical protein
MIERVVAGVRRLGSPADAWLATRMTGWALALPFLKHAMPLPRLARLMWRNGRGSVTASETERVARLARMATRLRPLPGRDNCLERSLIAYRYLSALDADPRLVVAARSADGDLDGHVWVTVRGTPVLGEDVSPFTPLFELGREGMRVAPSPR